MHSPHEHHHDAGPSHACCHGGGSGAASLRDPVCGMSVTTESKHRVEHDGQTYYFCSGGCAAKFQSAPARYLHGDGPAAMPKAPAPVGTIYTCPMHPEIR